MWCWGGDDYGLPPGPSRDLPPMLLIIVGEPASCVEIKCVAKAPNLLPSLTALAALPQPSRSPHGDVAPCQALPLRVMRRLHSRHRELRLLPAGYLALVDLVTWYRRAVRRAAAGGETVAAVDLGTHSVSSA